MFFSIYDTLKLTNIQNITFYLTSHYITTLSIPLQRWRCGVSALRRLTPLLYGVGPSVTSCPIRRQAPRLDEYSREGYWAAESAMYHCCCLVQYVERWFDSGVQTHRPLRYHHHHHHQIVITNLLIFNPHHRRRLLTCDIDVMSWPRRVIFPSRRRGLQS